jgi:glyoxylase I family protein
MIKVLGIDHLVLVTPDVERAVAWYTGTLGLVPERLEEWRAGQVLFASLRISPTSIIDVFAGERTGVNVDHLALVVDPSVDLHAVAASGTVEVDHEPFVIWGAQGHGLGMYVRDPDGNRIELKQYAAS